MHTYILRGKAIIMLSVAFLLLATGLEIFTNLGNINFSDLSYESVNIKDISKTTIEVKKNSNTVLNNIFNKQTYNALTEVSLEPIKKTKASKVLTNEDIWHLPTQRGEITQYPNKNHVAFDISSPRGSMENVFPIADGIVSGIFTDSMGALIVTISHNINNLNYTSEYVHLSSYANGLYVGKAVTINDIIGKMGQTGYAFGTHLHLALVDCQLFAENDANCKDLNQFYNYAEKRLNEGFIGLGSLINVPNSWG